MSLRWPNSIVNKTLAAPTDKFSSSAPGEWKLDAVAQYVAQGVWPSGATAIEDVFSTYLYTGNGSTQTINNGIALGPASTGGGLYFSGSTTSLNYAANTAFQATGDFTIECWFNFSSFAGTFPTVFSLGDNNSGSIRVTRGTDGTLYLLFNGATAGSITSDQYSTGTWYHLAISRSGSNVRYFLNGVLKSTLNVSVTLPNYPLTIGGWNDGTNNTFNGYISNFRFVKGTAVYTANFTPSTAPLTAISGTSLLIGQSSSPLTDNSTNAFVPTNVGVTANNSVGPFLDYTNAKGGMVWIKYRGGASDNSIFDTLRGAGNFIPSNSTVSGYSNNTTLTSFNSNGFSLGSDSSTTVNFSGFNYASWTFRKAPKFFDVVTYTGNGVNGRTISHSLGTTPGMVIVKCTSVSSNWAVYHRSQTSASYYTKLNLTDAQASDTTVWNGTAPTSSVFSVGTSALTNTNGATYVAYLFAHDTTTDGLIQCGSFTTDASGNATVNLGWEPQYVLMKNSTATGSWSIFDNMRGASETSAAELYSDLASAESVLTGSYRTMTSTGFKVTAGAYQTRIYMAIRRGPMRTPTDGTKVFQPVTYTGNGSGSREINTTITSDAAWFFHRNTVSGQFWYDRLRGNNRFIRPSETAAESSFNNGTAWGMDRQTSVYLSSSLDYINGSSALNGLWCLKRAPGFFDVVCYTGTGVARTVNHNLGVAPELMIVKRRDAINSWFVYAAPRGANEYGLVNFSDAFVTPASLQWNSTVPTTSVFTVGTATGVNASAGTYVAYLFASCPGVSKVGSYSGTGATQTISCGFTGGARFVLIKRTDSTGDWYVWDTARGMVAGTDPRLALNLTDAETNANWVYTTTGGFQIVTTDASVNASGGSYIYLAIA